MYTNLKIRSIRLALLLLFVTGVLLLSLSNAAWATPSQHPLAQTIPLPTPTTDPGGGGGGGGDDDDDDDGAGGFAYPEPEPEPEPTSELEPEPSPEPATPEPDGEFIDIEPGEGDRLILLPWEVIITPVDFDQSVRVEGRVIPGGEGIRPNEGDVCITEQLNIIIVDADGNQLGPGEFLNPIEIRYTLTPEDLARVDGDPSRIVIRVYDPELGIWVDLVTTYDPETNSVYTLVNYTGQFAVCILPEPEELPIVLPETGGDIIPITLPDTGGELPAMSMWLQQQPAQHVSTCLSTDS